MEGICKDQVEEIAELELPDESVEVTINTSKGCAEKIDIPAADHQFPNGDEIIHCKQGTGKVLGVWPKTLQYCSQSMQETSVTWNCCLG